jgi:hypothetical protein
LTAGLNAYEAQAAKHEEQNRLRRELGLRETENVLRAEQINQAARNYELGKVKDEAEIRNKEEELGLKAMEYANASQKTMAEIKRLEAETQEIYNKVKASSNPKAAFDKEIIDIMARTRDSVYKLEREKSSNTTHEEASDIAEKAANEVYSMAYQRVFQGKIYVPGKPRIEGGFMQGGGSPAVQGEYTSAIPKYTIKGQ